MFELYANKNELAVRKREAVTSGSVNVCRARFEFSPDWAGLTRKAVFKAGEEHRTVLLDESGACVIPWEVLKAHGCALRAGVFGTQDETALPTTWAFLGTILEGVPGDGPGTQPPTPDLWEQELARKGDGLDYDGLHLSLLSGKTALSTVEISGGGSGTQGPPGPQGEPGPQGPAGADGTDGATFTPSVSSDGTLSWTNDGGLPNPEPVNIKGPPGEGGVTMEQVNAAINAAITGAIEEAY